MNVRIELMREEQLEEVAQIFVRVFNSVGENWTYETALQNIRESFFGDCHYAAIVDGKIAGFTLAIPLTREYGTELFVASIAVLSGFQKQGVGRMLWDKLEGYAKENKFAGIRLLTNPHLQSYHWYKEMGFKESGWVEAYKKI